MTLGFLLNRSYSLLVQSPMYLILHEFLFRDVYENMMKLWNLLNIIWCQLMNHEANSYIELFN